MNIFKKLDKILFSWGHRWTWNGNKLPAEFSGNFHDFSKLADLPYEFRKHSHDRQKCWSHIRYEFIFEIAQQLPLWRAQKARAFGLALLPKFRELQIEKLTYSAILAFSRRHNKWNQRSWMCHLRISKPAFDAQNAAHLIFKHIETRSPVDAHNDFPKIIA